MRKIQSRLMINGLTVVSLAAAGMSYRANAQQQVALTPNEYGLWESNWSRSEVDELLITDVDTYGFEYYITERVRPHSPNTFTHEEGKASFLGPLTAKSQESSDIFVLRIAVDDRHDRDITYQDAVYEYPRSTFRAGFDCDKATTPVEITICRNERIAAGDREMTRLYRELLGMLPAEQKRAFRSDQRAWLTKRNRDCLEGNDVSVACLARLYSDRLVALARLRDPALGAGPLFDATYLTAVLARGAKLNEDMATRLAMYPYGTDYSSMAASVSPNGTVFIEQTYYGRGIELWPPIDLDFPIDGYYYSAMLFVDSDGTVWTAMHTEIDMNQDYQELVQLAHTSGHRAWRIWDNAGQSHFSIRSETGFAFELRPSCLDNFTERDHPLATASDPPRMPDSVKGWVSRHPVLIGDRTCCGG